MSRGGYEKIISELDAYQVKNKISKSETSRRCGIASATLRAFWRNRNGMDFRHFDRLCRFLGHENAIEILKLYLDENDLSGKTFGHWTVLHPVPTTDISALAYRCRCVCGAERDVLRSALEKGVSKSCGCKRAEHQTAEQVAGKIKGQKIRRAISDAGLGATYLKSDPNKNSQSGVRGVSPLGDKWRATIVAGGKQYHLGTFDKIEDAIAARRDAEERLHKPLAERVKTVRREAGEDRGE